MKCSKIMGTSVRLDGLLWAAAETIGIHDWYDIQEVIITRDKAAQILSEMICRFEKGLLLTENGQINGITIYNLTESVEALSKLFDWITRSNEDELIFK